MKFPYHRTAAPDDMLKAIKLLVNPSPDAETHATRCFTDAKDSRGQSVNNNVVGQFAKLLIDALRNSKAAYDAGKWDGMVSCKHMRAMLDWGRLPECSLLLHPHVCTPNDHSSQPGLEDHRMWSDIGLALAVLHAATEELTCANRLHGSRQPRSTTKAKQHTAIYPITTIWPLAPAPLRAAILFVATFEAAQWNCFRKKAKWETDDNDIEAISYIPVISLFMQGTVLGQGKVEHMLLTQAILGLGDPFTMKHVRFLI